MFKYSFVHANLYYLVVLKSFNSTCCYSVVLHNEKCKQE